MEEGKSSANKLDMRATKGCSYKQSKKEAIITIIAYIIWGSWGIAIAGLFGFGDNISYMWGMPTWITLGVIIPIVVLVVWVVVYLYTIYKD